MTRFWVALFLAGLLCASGRAWAQPASPEVQDSSRIRKIEGDVLIKAEFNKVLVAVDEADGEGHVDGHLDHLFVFLTLEPVLPSFTLRDAWTEIELRPMGIRVLAHTERRELGFAMHRSPLPPRSKETAYPYRAFEWGLNLYRYSGRYLNSLSLEDVAEKGADAVPLAEQKSEAIDPGSGTELQDFTPAPTDSAGGSCQSTCSKTCGLGSCSAACNLLGCAKCECVGDPPVFPNCTCYLK